jgi:transposase
VSRLRGVVFRCVFVTSGRAERAVVHRLACEGGENDVVAGDETERLRAENVALRAAVGDLESERAALKAALEALEVELERLLRQAGTHSGNSGKPPSSDTITDRAKHDDAGMSRAERRRAARAKAKKMAEDASEPKRRPGKQPGDPGSTLSQVADPDIVKVHAPTCCVGCGADLAAAEVIDTEVRQVHDLPTRRLEVTEHRAETRRCGCGRTTKAGFPTRARSSACYGSLVRAVGVYLTAGQPLPVARAAELLAQVCGAPVSTGWLASLAGEAATGLEEFLEALKAQLRAEDLLHADETSARVSGRLEEASTFRGEAHKATTPKVSRSPAQVAALPLTGDDWHPEWNYDLAPTMHNKASSFYTAPYGAYEAFSS